MKEQEKSTRKIWHDANEEPDTNLGSIVAVNCAGEIAAFNVGTLAMDYVNEYSIDKWAYIDDLLNINPDTAQEVPASEDMEEESERCWKEMFPLGWSETSLLTLTHDQHLAFARHYANWQKQQMMKNCAVGYVIARNKNCLHPLRIYDNIPKRYACDDGREFWMGNDIRLPDTLFPEITWEDEPKEVKLIIIKED